jgi:hypothetical protein
VSRLNGNSRVVNVAIFASSFVAKAGWLLPMLCCKARSDDGRSTQYGERRATLADGAAGKGRQARRRG